MGAAFKKCAEDPQNRPIKKERDEIKIVRRVQYTRSLNLMLNSKVVCKMRPTTCEVTRYTGTVTRQLKNDEYLADPLFCQTYSTKRL
jgi:hypothetical protein